MGYRDEQRKQKLDLQSNNNELVPNIEQRITKEINLLSLKKYWLLWENKKKKFAIQKTDCILQVDNKNDGNDNDTNDGNTTTSARSNNTTVVFGSIIGFGHNKFSIPHASVIIQILSELIIKFTIIVFIK